MHAPVRSQPPRELREGPLAVLQLEITRLDILWALTACLREATHTKGKKHCPNGGGQVIRVGVPTTVEVER